MRIKVWVVMFLVLLVTIPLYAETYSADDLWILEIIINEDMASSQVTDALIIEKQVYLPLSRIASILKVPVNLDYERALFAFNHPESQVPIVVDGSNRLIQVNNEEPEECKDMYMVNGELFLALKILGELMDAKLEYVEQHLVVYLHTAHLAKREEKRNAQEMMNSLQDEDVPAFSISNIKYRWTVEWEKSCSWIKVIQSAGSSHEGAEDDEEETIQHKKEEDWNTRLQVDMKGTIYDWKYQLGAEVTKEKSEPVAAEINKYLLTYNMDYANFSIGKMAVIPESVLNLKKIAYDGVAVVSKISPVSRMNGNIIQITGEAPVGSKVKLYVNKWLVEEQVVRDAEVYFFKDVLLSYSDMVNEIKVLIKKKGGEVEEIYRYVSVSEAVLNKGEVDYLVQAGKLKADDCKGNYLLNSIVYWGVTEETTLGVSWYSEIKNKISCIEQLMTYNYNSLHLNQRLSDNLVLKGSLYHVQSQENETNQQDLGYKVSLDYKNPETQAGLEYHKEAKQFKDKDEIPFETVRLYFIQSVESNGMIEGQAAIYNNRINPEEQQKHWEIGYKTEKEKWNSSLNFSRDLFAGEKTSWQNEFTASLSYRIRPNLKLLQDVEYKAKWNQMLSKEIGAGIQGLYELDEHVFIAGIDWIKNITESRCSIDSSLSWSKQFKISKNQYISTELGYHYLVSGDNVKHRLPLSVRYSYVLPNDAHIQLYYKGQWEHGENGGEVEHKLGLSLEGAFNFFGGKITSTSPHAASSKIGMVSGVVFRDSNRNGQFDEGEMLLSGIPVRLDRKIQYTDAEGRFCFKEIPHGVHYLGFDYSHLPIELTPSTADKNVKVEANGEVKEMLGLYVVGAVDGNIYVQELPEGLHLRGIKLVAVPGGYAAYTDIQGYYYFDQIPPGEYQISVDTLTLPPWVLPTPVRSQTIQITENGEYVSGIDFTLSLNPEYQKQEIVEEVEVIQLQPTEPAEAETIEDVPETIETIEKRLIELDENILKVDLSVEIASFNGEEIQLIPFFLMEEKIWAPIRAVAQLFNSRVFWDPENQRIYIVDQDKNILFDIKLGYLMINGVEQELQDGIRVVNDFTFISLEDLALIGLSAKVEDNILYIYYDGNGERGE